jgi:seryl-tRNA synthetase
MPPHTAGDRPRTRSKNANAHPGTAAQDALRVNAPRRDPAIIQKEKDDLMERKALKTQVKEANQARNETTKRIADEFRAKQTSEQVNDQAEIPRKMSKGRVSISDIP